MPSDDNGLKAHFHVVIPKRSPSTVGELHFRDIQTSSHYVGFKCQPSNPSNLIWILPSVDSNGPLLSDGSENLIFGTRTGNTNEMVTATGAATNNYPLLYDASGNAIARQPRGNTTVVQLADSTTNPTSGDLALFDANGNVHAGTLANNTDNDVSTSQHGLAPKAPNDATKYLDGTGAYSTPAGSGGSGALVLLEQHTASSSAALNFTSWYSSSYDTYEIVLVGLIPATSGVDIALNFSTNGGSSYDTANNYAWNILAWTKLGDGLQGSDSYGQIVLLTIIVTNNAAWSASGTYRLYNPGSTSLWKQIHGMGWGITANDGRGAEVQGQDGSYKSTSAVNAFRIICSSGNIASGTVRVYGVAH